MRFVSEVLTKLPFGDSLSSQGHWDRFGAIAPSDPREIVEVSLLLQRLIDFRFILC